MRRVRSAAGASRSTVLVQLNNLALGGTQINAVDLASALIPHGFDSVLMGPRDTILAGPSLFDVARDRGIQVEIFDRPTTTIAGARLLSRRARECGADIVHVYGTGNARSAYWGPALLARRPLVLTVYEMAVSEQEFASPPLVVGTGYLIDDLRARPGQTRLVSPPVDLERDRVEAVDTADFLRVTAGTSSRAVRIVAVTRLDEEMKALSVEIAIRAVDRSVRHDLMLVIVGTGDAEIRLRALGRQVNERLGRRAIVFAGPLADPRAAYASADLVLGMGGSAARALAFGRPLIVQGEFGWSQTFMPSTAAALFRNSFWSDERPPHPVDDLVRQVEILAADPAARKQLGVFGRDFSVGHFGLEAMAARLAGVYAGARRAYRARDWARDLDLEWAAVSRARLARLHAPRGATPPTRGAELVEGHAS
ncbi:glycosyltransferase [Cryobacterium frigoriphilum]|uniref:D-inositol 3-phosphate glycosyltransferase n=1 Tax=Cryobacterium frigoriphilum TaxID=1259150 RepID=A0A4R9A5Q8_9MICO|nr:glycosyltransferase [Cryobacterium frigoriphilum]TFD52126.1 glycosyltransferase [Cryobacterium frigoriphilum]